MRLLGELPCSDLKFGANELEQSQRRETDLGKTLLSRS
jgi:hypothetical protein